ncbi:MULTISPECIES: hypothetical protein [Kitasatospora]|uniref:YcaO domain-containing protein n=1 Tax=Kitasatospora cathayae TaxID=3004092 RepID=A0ABY7PVY8_9ACTN|nr:hypothetical protein [Kitasatospora sp. HUAS 3-15]WBP84599.1 hypothetical protein O1G21_01165 [Kitasatospora sp. HUAS 3-15]
MLSELDGLVKALDRLWGRVRGEATLYVPYRLERNPHAFGLLEASTEFGTLSAGPYTCSGNSFAGSPEEAARHLRDLLLKEVGKHGVPFNAQPFPPGNGLAITLTVTSPR